MKDYKDFEDIQTKSTHIWNYNMVGFYHNGKLKMVVCTYKLCNTSKFGSSKQGKDINSLVHCCSLQEHTESASSH